MNSDITVLKCPNCDAGMTEGTERCEYCGTRFVVNKKQTEQPSVVINITNPIAENLYKETPANTYRVSDNKYLNMKPKNKWVAFFLCLFFGVFGAHKFYENKNVMGIVYLFTGGLLGIGWIMDLFVLLAIPINPYYVK